MALSRRKKIIAWVFISLVGLYFWFIVINPLLSLFFENPWPEIKDPSKLLQDCEALLSDYPRIVKDVYWPESVKALSPVVVYGNKQYVEIRISGGGVGSSWGYLVYPNIGTDMLIPHNFFIRESIYPGRIFKYVDKAS